MPKQKQANLTFQRLPIFAKADHPSQFALIDISNTTDQPSCSGYPHPQDAKDLELDVILYFIRFRPI
ncbi:unnamed protein product [Colias eurytheme]|nr:unnamed protein product [Colias eurytheme]